MDPLPEVVPISELRTRQNEILGEIAEQPIVLTQHGRAVGVLLGPELYNRLLGNIEDLQLALDAIEARAEAEPVTDFQDYLAERGEHVQTAADE